MEDWMEENKITSLAKSFTASCRQVIKEGQLPQRLASPAVIAVAMTVLSVMAEGDIDKRIGWAIR